jgi:acetamidase/formamidase
MGDGEFSGSGVEVGARVEVTIGLEKGTGRSCRMPRWRTG